MKTNSAEIKHPKGNIVWGENVVGWGKTFYQQVFLPCIIMTTSSCEVLAPRNFISCVALRKFRPIYKNAFNKTMYFNANGAQWLLHPLFLPNPSFLFQRHLSCVQKLLFMSTFQHLLKCGNYHHKTPSKIRKFQGNDDNYYDAEAFFDLFLLKEGEKFFELGASGQWL